MLWLIIILVVAVFEFIAPRKWFRDKFPKLSTYASHPKLVGVCILSFALFLICLLTVSAVFEVNYEAVEESKYKLYNLSDFTLGEDNSKPYYAMFVRDEDTTFLGVRTDPTCDADLKLLPPGSCVITVGDKPCIYKYRYAFAQEWLYLFAIPSKMATTIVCIPEGTLYYEGAVAY